MSKAAIGSAGAGVVSGETDTVPTLAAEDISKLYGSNFALRDVSFAAFPGEVHALLGENGAGKSTMVGVLGGAVAPNNGRLLVGGAPVSFRSAADAIEHGVAVVHQELALMPHLSVADNIALRSKKLAGGAMARMGLVNRRYNAIVARRYLDILDVDVDVNALVGSLDHARRQMIEIAGALAANARVIILDEPTSSLPPQERERLFGQIKLLTDHGVAVVLITHFLEEALTRSDRITVLRDGQHVAVGAARDFTMDSLVEHMTGRPVDTVFPSHTVPTSVGVPRLELRGVEASTFGGQVSLTVAPGEIVGLAGLVGSGRTECMEAVFGIRDARQGSILLDGEVVSFHSSREAMRAGVAYIPEDRNTQGLFPSRSVAENIAIGGVQVDRGEKLARLRGILLSKGRIRRLARSKAQELRIVAPSLEAPVRTLSGGNAQKAIIARVLSLEPGLVLADDPTRGVSIGSKVEIYGAFRALAERGSGVLIVSSDFEELVGLCDRIVVVDRGASVATVPSDGMDAAALLSRVLVEAAQ